ncbi:hypothetical protein AB6N23_01940 [Cellulomonas sp. 179-A 9B4 NHS]|uniref:hypothetical protein n=1 Tax=Cellulomonas sp. 179-A 9B4 NHS TaxID=3142379 RepID=UPI0039A15508
MTYAQTATALRTALSDLLVDADVPRARTQRPLTAEESRLVQAYRASVLTWINRTTQAVVPDDVARADVRWGPARHFADHLNRIAVATTTLTPAASTLDLGTMNPNPTVESWRQAAVAATIGLDREFDAVARLPQLHPRTPGRPDITGTSPGRNYAERLRVVDDNAALTNALILLDVRIGGRPGWHRLGGARNLSGRREVSTDGLLNALELCRRWTRAHDLPTTVDERGHRAAPEVTPGPVRPGMPGVLAALRNTAARLDARPNGEAMRLLVRSQAALTHDLARITGDDPALGTRRARYRQLVEATTNLGGKLGGPALALLDSEQARALLVDVTAVTPAERDQALDVLHAIDHKIATHVRAGATDATYLVAHGRELAMPGPGGVRRAVQQWARIDATTAPVLLPAARALLETTPVSSTAGDAVPGQSRADLDRAVTAATPDRTASTSSLLGPPARDTLTRADLARLRAASFPSPAVEAATHDYLLRRPQRSGGVPTNKGKGKEPPAR